MPATLGAKVSQWRILRREDLSRCDNLSEEDAPTRNARQMLRVIRYLAYLHANVEDRARPPGEQDTWKQKIGHIEKFYGLADGKISYFGAFRASADNLFHRFAICPLRQVPCYLHAV